MSGFWRAFHFQIPKAATESALLKPVNWFTGEAFRPIIHQLYCSLWIQCSAVYMMCARWNTWQFGWHFHKKTQRSPWGFVSFGSIQRKPEWPQASRELWPQWRPQDMRLSFNAGIDCYLITPSRFLIKTNPPSEYFCLPRISHLHPHTLTDKTTQKTHRKLAKYTVNTSSYTCLPCSSQQLW